MNRRKLLIIVISLAACLATLLSQESLAYYSVLGDTTNVITTGEISIRIVERMGSMEYPEEGVYVMPGSTVSKKVSVQNTGEHPCWLRIKLSDGISGDDLSTDIYELDINKTDWIAGEDGFYYYGKILEAGVETESLFTQVKIAGDTDNNYKGAALKLRISAFAVQSEHNDTAGSPLEVSGWPAEK